MRESIHPPYGPAVFRDRSAGFQILTRSTLQPEQTGTWEDGREYPVVDVEISSASHPFYTGAARVVDTAGRVERFRRRYGARGTGTGTGEETRSPGSSGGIAPGTATGTEPAPTEGALR